jgi:alpha-D-ribose 1-methylphosphonate 5-triphosphate synthase subunit PhnI
LAARGQLPDKLQQQALREQAVAGASRLLNHLMGNVASRPLQTADNQLPGIVIRVTLKVALASRVWSLSRSHSGFTLALGFACRGGGESKPAVLFSV